MKAERVIADALVTASRELPDHVEKLIAQAAVREKGRGRIVLDAIMENTREAASSGIPMCQDTGMLWVWCEIGRKARVDMAELEKLILRGARRAFRTGGFRSSVVTDPMEERRNTGNNMPPVITYSIAPGSDITLHFLLKGFGSENCSGVVMLNPTAGEDGVVEAVLSVMRKAGAKPCPPVFLGVGVGGTMDRAAAMSKEAFFKRGAETALEKRIRESVNREGSGPGGLGGENTCLRVSVKSAPTHIAGLPVAVTVNCWAERLAEVVLKGGWCGEEA